MYIYAEILVCLLISIFISISVLKQKLCPCQTFWNSPHLPRGCFASKRLPGLPQCFEDMNVTTSKGPGHNKSGPYVGMHVDRCMYTCVYIHIRIYIYSVYTRVKKLMKRPDVTLACLVRASGSTRYVRVDMYICTYDKSNFATKGSGCWVGKW